MGAISRFNPHPAIELDERRLPRTSSGTMSNFNPHPAIELDESQKIIDEHQIEPVSIHIQLLSWMKDFCCWCNGWRYLGFNPHPAIELDERAYSGYVKLLKCKDA